MATAVQNMAEIIAGSVIQIFNFAFRWSLLDSGKITTPQYPPFRIFDTPFKSFDA